MNSTVVVLLSDKRSGSTMLERELAKHPRIQHVHHCSHTFNETHHWLKGAVLLDLPARLFAGGRKYTGYGSKAATRAYIIDQICGNVPDYRVPRSDRELVFGGWEALCDAFAKPVFFEKSPQHPANWAALSLLAEWSASTDHRVRFISLTRNPSAVLYSAWRLFGTAPDERQHGWTEIHLNLLAFRSIVPADSLLQVKYEDLITKPQLEFERILHFIGLASHPDLGSSVHPQSLTKWRQDTNFSYVPSHSTLQAADAFGYTKEEVMPDKPIRRQASPASRFRTLRESLRNQFVVPLKLSLRNRGR